MRPSKQAKVVLALIALFFILKYLDFFIKILVVGGILYLVYKYYKSTQAAETGSTNAAQNNKGPKKKSAPMNPQNINVQTLQIGELEEIWTEWWKTLDKKINQYVERTSKYAIDFNDYDSMLISITRDVWTMIEKSTKNGWEVNGTSKEFNFTMRESYENYFWNTLAFCEKEFNIVIDERKILFDHKGHLHHQMFLPYQLRKNDVMHNRKVLAGTTQAKVIEETLIQGGPLAYFKNKNVDLNALQQQMFHEVQVMEKNINEATMALDQANRFIGKELSYDRMFYVVEAEVFALLMDKRW